MIRSTRTTRRLTTLVLLGVTLLASGCAGPGSVSEDGRERCRQRSERAGNPISAAIDYQRCLRTIEQTLAREKSVRDARAQQRRKTQQACLTQREKITALMATLRQAEQELDAVRKERFRPSSPPPAPLDPSKESRFRPEDQELDRERYEQDLAAWEDREASNRTRWQREHAKRLVAAQQRLNAEFRTLRKLRPDLFTGPASIEFDPKVARQVASCEATG